MFALHVQQMEESDHLVAGDQRNEHARLFGPRAWEHEATPACTALFGRAEHDGLARVHDVRRDGRARQRYGLDGHSLPVFVKIREAKACRLRFADADADVGLREDGADLFAHRIVDALHVEFAGERLLHCIDDRQLGVALLGFF